MLLRRSEGTYVPRLQFSERFAADLALMESPKLEARIMSCLDNIEMLGEFGSANIPDSVKLEFGGCVRKVAVNPFDLIYSYYPQLDLVRVEALIHQRAAW